MASPTPLSNTFGLEYMDFIPECLDDGGIFSHPEFERFDVLINRANGWLNQHPNLKARTCESIELKCRFDYSGELDTETMTCKEYGDRRNKYMRALRLWLAEKDPDDSPEPQQLRHINLVPECIEEGDIFSKPVYASYGETLNSFNQHLQQKPLAGKILCVETQDMKLSRMDGDVDADRTYWTESGERGIYFLNIIRIFIQIQEPCIEQIGCVDFVSDQLEESGFVSRAEFEPFSCVVAKARMWMSQQSGLRIVSIQSIDYKLKSSWSGGGLDTHRTLFYEKGDGYTHYVRILRVSYVRSIGPDPPSYSDLWMPKLNYRTFVPVQLTDDVLSTPSFETMPETLARATAWLRATRCRVLSAETVPVQLRSGNQYGDSEQVYTWNHGDRNKIWLFVIRVYLDGDYQEPPEEALPPVPEMVEGFVRLMPGEDRTSTLVDKEPTAYIILWVDKFE